MSEPVKKIKITSIQCRGLRSADFLTKNDVYVVFKAGTKMCKTKYVSGGGKNVLFKDTLELFVNDKDLINGIDFTAYDYDFGPDPDDLLGVGKLVDLAELKKFPNTQRQFDTHIMYKGKNRGEATCIVELNYPAGGQNQSDIGAVGGQIFNAAMNQAAPATVVQPMQQPQQDSMLVTCPANAQAGMQVVVQAPTGARLQVIIPAGVGPGMQFRVPFGQQQQQPQQPVAMAYAPPAYQQQQQQQQPQYAPRPQMMSGTAVDIDGDGRPDIVIPNGQQQPPPPQYGGYQQQQPQYGAPPPPQYGGYPPPQYGAPPPPQYGGYPPQGYPPPPGPYGYPPPRY